MYRISDPSPAAVAASCGLRRPQPSSPPASANAPFPHETTPHTSSPRLPPSPMRAQASDSSNPAVLDQQTIYQTGATGRPCGAGVLRLEPSTCSLLSQRLPAGYYFPAEALPMLAVVRPLQHASAEPACSLPSCPSRLPYASRCQLTSSRPKTCLLPTPPPLPSPGAFLQLYLTANKWRRGPNRTSQQMQPPAQPHNQQNQQQEPGAPRSPAPSPSQAHAAGSPHIRDPWLPGMLPSYYTTWLNDNVVDYGVALRFFNAPGNPSPRSGPPFVFSSPSAAPAIRSSIDEAVPVLNIPAFHSTGPTARDVAAAAAEHRTRNRSVLLAGADSAKCMAVPMQQGGGGAGFGAAGAGAGGQDGRVSLPWPGQRSEGRQQGSGPVSIGAGLASDEEQEQGQGQGQGQGPAVVSLDSAAASEQVRWGSQGEEAAV